MHSFLRSVSLRLALVCAGAKLMLPSAFTRMIGPPKPFRPAQFFFEVAGFLFCVACFFAGLAVLERMVLRGMDYEGRQFVAALILAYLCVYAGSFLTLMHIGGLGRLPSPTLLVRRFWRPAALATALVIGAVACVLPKSTAHSVLTFFSITGLSVGCLCMCARWTLHVRNTLPSLQQAALDNMSAHQKLNIMQRLAAQQDAHTTNTRD